MATAYLATNYKVPPQFRAPFAGAAICREFSFLASTALVVNDTIALCRLPAVCTLEDFFLDMPELDSGADALTWDLGDGTTADRWLAASTIGQAAGKVKGIVDGVVASLPCLITTAVDLLLTVKVAPNAGGTSTVSIRGWARYHFRSGAAFPAANA